MKFSFVFKSIIDFIRELPNASGYAMKK